MVNRLCLVTSNIKKSALHRNDITGGHGSVVSLQSIAVGKRHCRVLYIIPAQPELI
jgi:hypothetical protein